MYSYRHDKVLITGAVKRVAALVDSVLFEEQRGLGQAVTQRGFERRQALEGFLVEVERQTGAEGTLQLIAEIVLDALVGQELALRQMDGRALIVGPYALVQRPVELDGDRR